MKKKHRKYTDEFRDEALRFLETTDRSAAAIEKELGITSGLLSRWKRKRDNEAKGKAEQWAGESPEETIKRLKRENEILRQEREILKKAVAIFSTPK